MVSENYDSYNLNCKKNFERTKLQNTAPCLLRSIVFIYFSHQFGLKLVFSPRLCLFFKDQVLAMNPNLSIFKAFVVSRHLN